MENENGVDVTLLPRWGVPALSGVRTRADPTVITASSSYKTSPPDWYDDAALAGPEEDKEREKDGR